MKLIFSRINVFIHSLHLYVKVRTILAMIGVLVGTASVVAMVSSGLMATNEAIAQFKSLGTDLMSISLSSNLSNDNNPKNTAPAPFTFEKAMKIGSVSDQISLVAPYATLFSTSVYGGKLLFASIIGSTQTLEEIINLHMLSGRFISVFDGSEPFCVLGYDLYQRIKPKSLSSFLGTQIRIGNVVFTIIGIVDKWPENAFFNQNVNETFFIPIKAAQYISNDVSIDNIVIRLKSNADINEVQTAISNYLTKVVPQKNVFFRSSKELIKSMAAQHRIFTILLGCIGGISLIVGGIGVMNIILVSVLERRHEIGLRLAIGARQRDIQLMFLREAVLLSVIGGILGIIVGIIASLIIAEFAHWHLQIFFWPPLIGFVVSVLTGLVSGYYPARQASLLNPIETLQTE